MAKISARGAYKVVGYVYDATTAADMSGDERMEITYALRSDGAVLRKHDFIRVYEHAGRCRQSGGYSIVGKLKDRTDMRGNFERWLERKIVPAYGPAIRKAR